MNRQIIILTGGQTNPGSAKTTVNLLRYRPEHVAAILDPARAGQTAQQLFGLGGNIPVIGALADAPGANMLAIGIAPAGGKLPPEFRSVILDGISRKCDILSGLHEFLANDPEISAAARKHAVNLIDVRRNQERDVAQRKGINDRCLRVHTVGQDCNVGKMVVSLEIALALRKAGHRAKFVATGQTGMMIEGDGCPVDAVVCDFLNGAAEKLILAHQDQNDFLLIEGQGCITHPRYSAVTVGLLHGCIPQALILCYEMGRETVGGMDHIPLTPLPRLKELYESMASVMCPCQVIGVGINGRRFSDEEVRRERERVEKELGVPACDVLRHGSEPLVNAIMAYRTRIGLG